MVHYGGCFVSCTVLIGSLDCAGPNTEASVSGRQPTTESAEKLDALMGLVFEHLGRRCKAGQLQAAWNTVLHTFQRTILHTHRSKFTQYLIWYLCEKARLFIPFTRYTPTCSEGNVGNPHMCPLVQRITRNSFVHYM